MVYATEKLVHFNLPSKDCCYQQHIICCVEGCISLNINICFFVKKFLILTYTFCSAAIRAYCIHVNIRLSEWSLHIYVELRNVVKVDIYCLHVVLSYRKLDSSHSKFIVYLLFIFNSKYT